jgi:SAM-dependent methyltransferase
LLIAGRPLPAELAARRLGDYLDDLVALDIVIRSGASVVPKLRVLPIGPAFIVCDVDPTVDHVAPPDDSAFHLMGALSTTPVGSWLDVGCGSAVAGLCRPRLATRRVGVDLHQRAIDLAKLGASLSGDSIELACGDLFDTVVPGDRFDLVTFNAPIPSESVELGPTAPRYNRSLPGNRTLDRFWNAAQDFVTPDGEVIVHMVLPAEELPSQLTRPGHVGVARYTPAGSNPAFGVVWWWPGRASQLEEIALELSPAQPHVVRD